MHSHRPRPPVRPIVVRLLALLGVTISAVGCTQQVPEKYLLVNARADRRMLQDIAALRPVEPDPDIRLGVGAIFSYLQHDRDHVATQLGSFLDTATELDLPVLVQFDGEQWWANRPDLWNWWDADAPGYDPENRLNVEWSGWGPQHAVRIGWRNWDRQIRVLPMPNLMSPHYRRACNEEMRRLIPIVLDWWHGLPPDKKHLFVGIKLGWESAIGVNNFYYPDGNALADQSESDDPTTGTNVGILPSRGVATIGYAAVSTLGLADSGELTEAQLAEVTRVHLKRLARFAHDLGVPRERLFVHCGGWAEGEKLYAAALNPYACPAWSFYQHADDPHKDTAVTSALARSDAPYWAATEWLYLGQGRQPWQDALSTTLGADRCRYLCIYNWWGIKDNPDAVAAIRQTLSATGRGTKK
jgi:hypothetical protein